MSSILQYDPKSYIGRTVLYTNESEITSLNLLSVLHDVLPFFYRNHNESDYLYRYYRGEQPILKRVKKVRPEINNKLVENHAHEIVSFKTGYDFGEPVQYVRRATKSGTDVANDPNADLATEDMDVTSKIILLNEFMFEQDKASKDKDLAEWFFICGTAYRMVLPSEDNDDITQCPFEIDTLDSRHTGVVYTRAFGKKPVMSIQALAQSDGSNLLCIYTPTMYFEVLNDKILKAEPHVLGYIPVIEYPANSSRIGAFELVLGLLDEINNVESNRIDGIEQFVQSFMKFINVRMDEQQFEEFKAKGALMFSSEPGNPADVGIVTSELNQQQTQTVIDHLYQMVLIICGMPDRNGTNRTTGDTGQAVILRDGWTSAEAKAKDTEFMFKKSERQFLKLILKIVKDTTDTEIKLSDIDVKFTRNKTDNLLTKTQGMQNMLEAGIHPLIAITNSNLFSDPEQCYIDSLPYLQNKWKTKGEADDDAEAEAEKFAEENSDDLTKQGNEAKDGTIPANNKPIPKD